MREEMEGSGIPLARWWELEDTGNIFATLLNILEWKLQQKEANKGKR